MKTCTCPVGTAIQEISTNACPYNSGQIQKVAFQRKFSTGTTRNEFSDLTDIQTLASWTTLLSAVDGTKIQVIGPVANPAFPPGAVKEYGSDNQVPNGIPIVVGREHTVATMELLSVSPVVAAEIKALECEDLQAYFFNEEGQILCLKSGTDTYYGIDVEQLFISDRQLGGFAEPDKVMISMKLKPNWSDLYQIVASPNFDPLTALVN